MILLILVTLTNPCSPNKPICTYSFSRSQMQILFSHLQMQPIFIRLLTQMQRLSNVARSPLYAYYSEVLGGEAIFFRRKRVQIGKICEFGWNMFLS